MGPPKIVQLSSIDQINFFEINLKPTYFNTIMLDYPIELQNYLKQLKVNFIP